MLGTLPFRWIQNLVVCYLFKAIFFIENNQSSSIQNCATWIAYLTRRTFTVFFEFGLVLYFLWSNKRTSKLSSSSRQIFQNCNLSFQAFLNRVWSFDMQGGKKYGVISPHWKKIKPPPRKTSGTKTAVLQKSKLLCLTLNWKNGRQRYVQPFIY